MGGENARTSERHFGWSERRRREIEATRADARWGTAYGTQSKSGRLPNHLDALAANPIAQRNFSAVATL